MPISIPNQESISGCVYLPRFSTGYYMESLLHSASFLALGSAVINLIGHLPGPLVIVIDQFPRFVCSIEARIPRAKPEG